jgi:hypothetical protein
MAAEMPFYRITVINGVKQLPEEFPAALLRLVKGE